VPKALPWGIIYNIFTYPERVGSFNPFRVGEMVVVFIQGSASRATLGWRIESFQDSPINPAMPQPKEKKVVCKIPRRKKD
jgi:hypothetical protein